MSAGGGLDRIAQAAGAAGRGESAPRKLPPVHLWDPPYCGDIGMKIARDGTWFYQGSPIGRPAMVKLFSSILRKDPDRHVLVTPVEKVHVEVEDAPFLAVEMQVKQGENGPELHFRTNVDDMVRVDEDHPLRFEQAEADGIKPYVLVRGGLWALVTRALFYDLVELADVRDVDGTEMIGVQSAGRFFAISPAADLAIDR